jgi:hypothetical protein
LKKFILKFKDVAIQPSDADTSPVKRAVGFVRIDQIIPLLDSSLLAPNPRAAKRNEIVKGILTTLQDNPELFRFRSKGLLVSSHHVEELERKRFRVEISKEFVDGVLDGGHNLFALGLFLLEGVMDQQDWKRIKDWEQFDKVWAQYRDEVTALAEEGTISADVSVELLYPSDTDEDTLAAFDDSAFVISQARNANTAVADEAFQNKLGFYETLRQALPEGLSRRIEWKPGVIEDRDAKPIKVRDVIALAWIPLNLANQRKLLPIDISVTPQNIYRNKGECSEKFGVLMRHNDVTKPIGGTAGGVRKLHHQAVESCLLITADLPQLMDDIYEAFPSAYNSGGKYNFGRQKEVLMYSPQKILELRAAGKSVEGYTATKPTTPFFGTHTPRMVHKYPDAYIYPLVTALSALMKVRNGRIVWSVDDPRHAVLAKLEKVAPLFKGQLDAYGWDPQKVAKAESSHTQMRTFYEVM